MWLEKQEKTGRKEVMGKGEERSEKTFPSPLASGKQYADLLVCPDHLYKPEDRQGHQNSELPLLEKQNSILGFPDPLAAILHVSKQGDVTGSLPRGF